MTDHIRLTLRTPPSVVGPANTETHPPYVEIDAGYARQIVALAFDTCQFDSGTVGMISTWGERIAALERHTHAVGMGVTFPPTEQPAQRVDTNLFVGGAGLAPLQTTAPVAADKPSRPPGLPSRDARTPENVENAKYLTETMDEHMVRQIAAAKPARCGHPATVTDDDGITYCDQCREVMPWSQPAGDDAAAVTDICRTRRLARQCGMEQSHSVNAALDQMAHEVWCESRKEIADLRANLAEAERSRDDWRKCHDIVEQERAIPAERDRAALNVRVAELEAVDSFQEQAHQLMAERNRAREALAAMTTKYNLSHHEADCMRSQSIAFDKERQRLAKDLAAMTELVENIQSDHTRLVEERNELRKKAMGARAEADALRNLCEERRNAIDELVAERDAFKARNVTLPECSVRNCGFYNLAKPEIIAAIRAAGVACE